MNALRKTAAAHYSRGEYEDADRVCRRILTQDPENADAWHMRGLIAARSKLFEHAVAFLSNAVTCNPAAPLPYVNLGVAYLSLDKVEDAVRALERGLALDPGSAEARLNLGACHLRAGRLDAAETSAAHALSSRPEWPKALDLLARIALKKSDFDRAAGLAVRALAADPALPGSHRVMGDILMRRLDYDAARGHYLAALALDPDDGQTRGNHALLLTRLGRHEEAVAEYRRAMALEPDDHYVRHGLSLALLALGRFDEGWPLYGWRHLRDDKALGSRVAQPFPAGLPEKDAPLVVVADQGLGDQIMTASLIPDLLRVTSRLEVHCDARLGPLFRRSFPAAAVVPAAAEPDGARGEAPPGSVGLADLARWLRPDFAAFPRHGGYLAADAALRRTLRARYDDGQGRPLIGISWSTRADAKLAAQKSIPLGAWGPVLSVPGTTFVDLQYGGLRAEAAEAARAFGARIVSDPAVDSLVDFDAFAAQVAAMDLVITTSNTTAHVAGALNIPAWVFVPVGFGGLWHWFLDRDDSPWYPSVRLFRQSERGDWRPALEAASAALVDFLETRRARERSGS